MDEQEWLQEWGAHGLGRNKNKGKAKSCQETVDIQATSSVGLTPPDDHDTLLGYLIARMCEYNDSGKLLPQALDLLVERKLMAAESAEFIRRYPGAALQAYKASFGDLDALLKGGVVSRYVRDFEELCELGQGSAGVVRLCKHRRDGHRYAVKIVDVECQGHDESDEAYMERIRFIEREAKTLAELKHDNVIRYYQSWYEGPDSVELCQLRYAQNVDRIFFIQMEYCGRLTLESLLDGGSITDADTRIDMFTHIANGLHYIHTRNIIHRDLCPKNLFVDRHKIIKIGDFGLAKHHGGSTTTKFGTSISFKWSDSTQSHTTDVGTENYAAPEVSATSRFDTKADIFSLGVIFFDICNGKRQGSSREIYNELRKGTVPPSFIGHFPTEAALIGKMIDINPAERPNAKLILETLESFKGSTS